MSLPWPWEKVPVLIDPYSRFATIFGFSTCLPRLICYPHPHLHPSNDFSCQTGSLTHLDILASSFLIMPFQLLGKNSASQIMTHRKLTSFLKLSWNTPAWVSLHILLYKKLQFVWFTYQALLWVIFYHLFWSAS